MLGKYVIVPFFSINYIFSVNYIFLLNFTYNFAIITCFGFPVICYMAPRLVPGMRSGSTHDTSASSLALVPGLPVTPIQAPSIDALIIASY